MCRGRRLQFFHRSRVAERCAVERHTGHFQNTLQLVGVRLMPPRSGRASQKKSQRVLLYPKNRRCQAQRSGLTAVDSRTACACACMRTTAMGSACSNGMYAAARNFLQRCSVSSITVLCANPLTAFDTTRCVACMRARTVQWTRPTSTQHLRAHECACWPYSAVDAARPSRLSKTQRSKLGQSSA